MGGTERERGEGGREPKGVEGGIQGGGMDGCRLVVKTAFRFPE